MSQPIICTVSDTANPSFLLDVLVIAYLAGAILSLMSTKAGPVSMISERREAAGDMSRSARRTRRREGLPESRLTTHIEMHRMG
jgi:hypothetical protein